MSPVNNSHTTNNDTQKQLLKLEKQCTQLISKCKVQEERIRKQDVQLDLVLQLLIEKSEATRKEQNKYEDKKPRATTYERTPMAKMTMGGALLYVLQHHPAKLANELLDLSTLECPFQRTSRENVGFWKTSMLVMDALWTAGERHCVIRAAHNDKNEGETVPPPEIQSICDAMDHWALRLTSIVTGRPVHSFRPYMVGLAHNIARDGRQQEVFLPRTYKIEWTSPEMQAQYQTTTPLRDWIVEQELLRQEDVSQEEEEDTVVERVNGGGDKEAPDAKRPRVEGNDGE